MSGHARGPAKVSHVHCRCRPGLLVLSRILGPGQTINVWRPKTIKHCLVTKHFTVWTPCLVPFDRVWSCLINFEGHQTFKQQLKTFLLFSCLRMGDLLLVWTAAYQTCLKRACVPLFAQGLISGFNPAFGHSLQH